MARNAFRRTLRVPVFLAAFTGALRAQESLPELTIDQIDGSFFTLSWPFEAPDYLLEQASALTLDPAVWDAVPETPLLDETSYSLTLAFDFETQFYRLRFAPDETNHPPALDPIAAASVMPGSTLSIQLSASDPDLEDTLTFGVVPLPLPANATLNGRTGLFTFKPGLVQAGTYQFTFTVSDGFFHSEQTVDITVLDAHVNGQTAISGRVYDADAAVGGLDLPIAGVRVSLLNTGRSTLTAADGSFRITDAPSGVQVLDFNTDSAVPGPGGAAYAHFRERYPLIPRVDNVIHRPIYLPRVAAESLTPVDPNAQTVVTNDTLQVSISVPPHTAKAQNGSDFTGQLSISLVPRDLAPMPLPDVLDPAMLVTIQPVGVTFSTPVPITYPNLDGLAPGSEVNLWSLDPATGHFAIMGKGQVSADGQRIETIEGGVRAADWHAPLPPEPPHYPPPDDPPDDDDPHDDCEEDSGSSVAQASGALRTGFRLPAYRSLNEERALEFVYKSDRAYPYPVLPTELVIPVASAVPPALSYKLSIGNVDPDTETFVDTSGLNEDSDEALRIAAGAEVTSFPTGSYPYTVRLTSNFALTRVSADRRGTVHIVNDRSSPFGAGWGLAGLQRIIENEDGSVLLVDGNGAAVFFDTGDRRELLIGNSANNQNNAILRYSVVTGELLGFLVEPGAGGLMSAHNPTFGPDGNLYVVSGGNQILRFDGETGDFIDLFADCRPHQAGIAQIAFGPDGNLYTDLGGTDARQVLRYSGEDGSFLGVAAEGNGIQRVCGIAFGADGLLYLADQDRFAGTAYDRILRFNAETAQFIDVFVPSGNLDDTCPFEFGSDGHIYIADQWPRDIRRFNGQTGAYMGVFAAGPPITIPSTPFYARSGPDGLLYIANAAGIHRYRDNGQSGVFVDTFITGNTGFFTFTGEGPAGATEPYQSPQGDNSLLERLPDLSFMRTLPDGTVYRFNNRGLLVSVADASENTTTYSYDVEDRVVAITDPVGLATAFAYTGDALTQITDPAGRVTTFEHSPLGDLGAVVFPDGAETRFEYDERHLMTTETDARGFSVQREFDSTGRFVRSHLPDGSTRQGSPTRSVGLVDPASGQGSSRDPAPITRPEDAIATFTDGAGLTRSYEVGAFGEATRVVDPAGLVTTLDRDASGNVVRNAQPSGRTVLSSYDDLGNLLTEEDSAFGGTYSYTYEPGSDRVSSFMDPFDNATLYTYDTTGNLLSLTTPLGREFTYAYNARGQRASATSLTGAVSAYEYDNHGNLSRSTLGTPAEPGLRETLHTLSASGRIASTTIAGATTFFTYDPFDRLTSIQPPAPSGITRFTWDAEGALSTVTPPGRPAHQFTYTPMGQIAEYHPPATGAGDPATRMTYDGGKKLLSIARPDGKNVLFTYDQAGRPSTIQTSPGITRFEYDPDTGTTSAIRSPGPVDLTFTYSNGQVTRITWAGEVDGSVAFAYDIAGRLQSLQVNSRPAISRAYDEDGLQTALGALTLTRDAETGLVEGTLLNQLRTEAEYDFAGELTAYRAFFGAAPVYSADYRRDNTGRIDQVSESVGGNPVTTTSYTYAANGWLTTVSQGGADRERYVYDTNGNRSSALGIAPAPVHDAQDRLLSYGASTFSYSAAGEWMSASDGIAATGFVYDEMGNLRSLELPLGQRIDYVIDGEQRRVGRKVNGVLTQAFLYQDPLEPAAELDGDGNVVAEFAYLEGTVVPAFMLKNGRTYRILSDPNGSVRLVVDSANGEIAQRIDYDAFGDVLTDTNPGFQPFGFAGGIYERDAGLIRFGTRDYHPRTGRWTAKDPILFSGGSSNLYLYAHNDPINAFDPSGNAPEESKKQMDWKKIRDKIDKNSYENFDEFKKEWDKFKTDHWNWWQRNNPWDSQNPDFLSYLNQANSYAQHAFNNGVGP